MSNKGFVVYALLLSIASTVAVALVSAWLALNGYLLPWVTPLADGNGFAVHNAWILLPGFGVGVALAGMSHFLAVRRKNRGLYYVAWIVVVVVVAVTVLLLYGGACGYCAKVVCPGHVKSCGIKLQLSINFFQIYCACYAPCCGLPARSVPLGYGILPAGKALMPALVG